MTDRKDDVYRVNENHGELNDRYLERLKRVTESALEEHARVLAFRVDLHLPKDKQEQYSNAVIKRFIASLKAQINTYQNRRRKLGKRTYPCRLSYAWVREFGEINGGKHYHVLLLVNREVFHKAFLIYNKLTRKHGYLIRMVMDAWIRAINEKGTAAEYNYTTYPGVSHELNRKDGIHTAGYQDFIYHISYMAKEYTKQRGDGERNFGCSVK
ncbi:inovirus Gp2 family protein [Klebsiella pasteurii]|uniref:YagK/YfjJ C-terminal domain-containing protein n=1 Tax=Klebsiella pasteurii TaxID=2587529 RepID=A0A9Q9ULE6_9ENTR|nr:inovirus Gp2 family protein [Klebsiella pasteurii]VUS84668.1 hypothetical protein SB6410_03679 [Klebsiella pasteurii]VUT19276.1 hypothetical protein SB6409_04241 [Klebsiella pasteurii]